MRMHISVRKVLFTCPLCRMRVLEAPVCAIQHMNTPTARTLRDVNGGHLVVLSAPEGGPQNGTVQWLVECQSPNRQRLGAGARPVARVALREERDDQGVRLVEQGALLARGLEPGDLGPPIPLASPSTEADEPGRGGVAQVEPTPTARRLAVPRRAR